MSNLWMWHIVLFTAFLSNFYEYNVPLILCVYIKWFNGLLWSHQVLISLHRVCKKMFTLVSYILIFKSIYGLDRCSFYNLIRICCFNCMWNRTSKYGKYEVYVFVTCAMLGLLENLVKFKCLIFYFNVHGEATIVGWMVMTYFVNIVVKKEKLVI